MTQAVHPASLSTSRLVRFLSELAVSDVEVSHKNFAERLGQMINLPDSLKLARAHWELQSIEVEPLLRLPEQIRDEFLQARNALIQSIIKSFLPDMGSMRIRLPRPKEDATLEKILDFEPYRRFYSAHQAEMNYRVQDMQERVREAASCLTPELAQLALLDRVFEKSLVYHARDFFAVVPKQLLRKRFDYLRQQHALKLTGAEQDNDPQAWIEPGGWLDKFYREMRELLLAELEVRLQPVLGLIETLNVEEDINQ